MTAHGTVVTLNVGSIRTESDGRRVFTTAIAKRPVAGRARLEGALVEGDAQADLENHGGPNRALYAYASEDYAWWEAELGRTLRPGLFGENLVLRGIDVNGAAVGERWRIGDAIVRVTSPRIPCYKLAHAVGEADFVKRFADSLRPGAYLAIEREAEIGAGDGVEVLSRPEPRLTLEDFTRIYFTDRKRASELLAVDGMTAEWRAWAAAQTPRD